MCYFQPESQDLSDIPQEHNSQISCSENKAEKQKTRGLNRPHSLRPSTNLTVKNALCGKKNFKKLDQLFLWRINWSFYVFLT